MTASAANEIPDEVTQALQYAPSVILYALEPDGPPDVNARIEQLHGYPILGQAEINGDDRVTAVEQFEASIAEWDGMIAACFEPRHALRATNEGHTYDLLLCYACQQMSVYKDGKPMIGVGAGGSAERLNRLLVAKGLPLPHFYTSQAQAERGRERSESAQRWSRWQQATPRSLVPLLADDEQYAMGLPGDITRLQAPLAGEFPDRNARILVLLEWFGSGAGPWSGYPSYEAVAEKLLLSNDTADLVAAASSPNLTDRQVEGAARLFGGWQFNHDRPRDAANLPKALKQTLLEHVRAQGNTDNIQRAESWLGD
jgi:hypothetical protein